MVTPEQVVGRHAVFQAMRPAGVHRDIARDRAGELAGRVGRVEEILVLHRPGYAEIGPSGLHPDEAVLIVGFQHVREPRHAEDHAIGGRQRPAGETGPRAARHHRHALGMTEPKDRRHLPGRGRQHHRQRRTAIGGQRVAFVGLDLGGVGNDRLPGQDRAQPRDDLGLAREDGRIGFGHLHRVVPPSLVPAPGPSTGAAVEKDRA